MIEHALALAEQGFLVFPIAPGKKTPPLVAGWQNVATADTAQVRDWWARWPNANIGIHCADLLVIDVDPKKGGEDSLEALEKEIQLDETLEVTTPSGGRHIYYRCAGGVRNGVDVLGPGLDIRSTNGYVVGAGSETEVGEYAIDVDAPVADAARNLVERIAVRTRPAAPVREEEAAPTDIGAAVARAEEFLASHPPAVEGQGGDHHTFRTLCRVRDFGVPDSAAAGVMAEWNARCVPPWLAEELAVKIHNAYRYAENPQGILSPEGLGFETVADGDTSAPHVAPSDTKTSLIHPADVDPLSVLKTEYLIKGVLERQSNAVIFGHWNVGKTFVVLDMAAAIATGEPWFGKRVRQGRVLYLGYEGLRAMKKRLLALRAKHEGLQDRDTPFEWHALRLPLTRADGVAELGAILRAFAERHGGAPDLIIIDPLQNTLGGDDSDAQLMGALNELVLTLIQRQRCTVLRVHHSGHANADRARGHSSLPAGLDTEIRVDQQEIALTKQRDDVRGRFFFKLDVVSLGKDADGDMVTTCTVSQIEENPTSPDLTGPQREALDAMIKMKGDGQSISKTEIRDCTPDMDVAQRRELLRVLARKNFLREEQEHYVICERGPEAIFD